jgi:hypothetical protein
VDAQLRIEVDGEVAGSLRDLVTDAPHLVEWQDNGAFERLSDNGNSGDWNPWILYVALVWGFFVVLDALKVFFDRPTTEAEVDRTVERIRWRR